MPDAVRVFVSHSSADTEFARTLVSDLRNAGADVWVDFENIDHNDFVAEINDALAQCQWMVFLVSPAALSSSWVQLETNIGMARLLQHKLRGILPTLVAPIDEDLIPPTWSTLERYDATRDRDLAIRWILSTIGLTSDTVTQPNTIIVDANAANGPHTIAEALAIAGDYDRIKLVPGVYREALDINKPIQLVGQGQEGEVTLAPPLGRGLVVSAAKVRLTNLTVWVGAPKDLQRVYAQEKAADVANKALGAAGLVGGGLLVAGAVAAHVAFPPSLIIPAGMVISGLLKAMKSQATDPGKIEALQVLPDASLELREVEVRNSQGVGIVVRGQVAAYQSRIHKCKVAGCVVEGEIILEDSKLTGNTIGLAVRGNGRVSAFRNRILGNGIAVNVEGSGSGVIQDNVLGGNRKTWKIAKDRISHVQHDRNVEDLRE
jgi:TIR domain